jgi:hypothetical protein
VAAIAADDEGGTNLDLAGWGVGADAGDAVAGFDKAGGFVLHQEMKAGQLRGLRGEEIEEVPLRHEGNELGVGGEMSEVAHAERLSADGDGQLGELLMREREELVEQTKLVEELERRGMDGVAAEVAEEVFVFFEDSDIDSGAGEEEAEHDSGWASADDAACGIQRWVTSVRHGAARVASG